MIYKTQPIEYLIARVTNNFNIDFSDWKVRAIEWVGEGLSLMEVYMALETSNTVIEIDNYLGVLPCDFEAIEAVEYNNKRLDFNSAPLLTKSSALQYIQLDNQSFTFTKDNYIHTTFESGEITIYYKKIPTDERGYPKVPDDAKVVEALSWFILLRLVGRGYQHPVFNNYEKLEFKVMGQNNPFSLFAQARNSAYTADNEVRLLYHKLWSGLIPYRRANDNILFNGIEYK